MLCKRLIKIFHVKQLTGLVPVFLLSIYKNYVNLYNEDKKGGFDMEIIDITNLVGTVGFPIFVAVWLLWKSDRTEKRTQEILVELKLSINKLCERINGAGG